MAASNRHRRSMKESTNFNGRDVFCMFECDPELNPTGVCSRYCAATCPYFCPIIDISAPPSSSPSPSNCPYSQTPQPAPAHYYPQLSFPVKLSLIFLVVTFMYTLYKLYTVSSRSRRRHTVRPPSPENQETLEDDAVDHPIWYIRTAGLQLSVINAIAVVKFNKGRGIVVGNDCTVCLTEFEADETLRILPNCKHAFHISCIDTWLRSHTNCPLCRAGIVDNTSVPPSPEQNSDDFGTTGETNSRISVMEEDNRQEASGSSDHRGMGFQSVDGGSGIELVKIEQTTDN